MDHLDRPRFARLLRGSGPSGDAWSSVIHLSGCRRCTRALVEWFPEEGHRFLMRAAQLQAPKASEEAWAAQVESWLQEGWTPGRRHLPRHREEEIEQAPRLAALLPEDPGRAALLVRNRKTFAQVGLGAYLLAHAQEEQGTPEGRELAERAARVLEAVMQQLNDPTVWDLAARARLHLALEAIRLGDRSLARSCLTVAEGYLPRGAGATEEREIAERVRLEILWYSACSLEVLEAARSVAASSDAVPHHLAGLHRTLARVALERPEPSSAADTHASVAFQAWLSLRRQEQLAMVGWLEAVITPTWVRRLLAEARGFWRRDARQAEELARLAVVMAEAGLDKGVFGRDAVLSSRTLARGYLAASLRARRRFREAERELAAAWDWLERVEQPEPLDRAWLLRIEAALAMDLQQFSKAAGLAAQARRAFFQARRTREGLAMIVAQANVALEAGHLESALRLLEDWSPLLTREALGRTYYFTAIHLQGVILARLNRAFEARRILSRLQQSTVFQKDWRFEAHLIWLEALVQQGLGQGAQALRSYGRVRDLFLTHGLWADAAMVLLEVAELCLRQGRLRQVQEAALQAAPILAFHGIDRESLAALRLFVGSACRESLTIDLIHRIRSRLNVG